MTSCFIMHCFLKVECDTYLHWNEEVLFHMDSRWAFKLALSVWLSVCVAGQQSSFHCRRRVSHAVIVWPQCNINGAAYLNQSCSSSLSVFLCYNRHRQHNIWFDSSSVSLKGWVWNLCDQALTHLTCTFGSLKGLRQLWITSLCVSMYYCVNPNMVVTIKDDHSAVISENFLHPARLYADLLDQGHRDS